MTTKWLYIIFVFAVAVQCRKDKPEPVNTRLGLVKTWMYQLEGLENSEALTKLSETDYDMLVIEPGDDFKDSPYYSQELLSRLRYTPGGTKRLLIAYIDIGQAEVYRNYWKGDWIEPTENSAGYPDFLIAPDPDGWDGSFTVKYWDTAWKSLWVGPAGRIAQLAQMGFDGVYLDWVDAYDEVKIRALAGSQGKIPEKEMLDFIGEIRESGKEVNPDFMVIQQNAPYLIDFDAEQQASLIDALAVEDTWFSGYAGLDWTNPLAGDLQTNNQAEYSTDNRLKQYKKFLDRNIPVFTVDYCIAIENAGLVYHEARKNNLIPLVTRVSLSRLTDTPPFDFP
jgi:cysteinyl-tRNA synthetase, unknown class